MPAQPEDFLSPDGELLATWFASQEIALAAIAKWQTKAATLGITDDATVEAYVYYRGYGLLYRTLVLSEPSTQVMGDRRDTFSKEQIEEITSQYKFYRSAVADIVPNSKEGSGGPVLTGVGFS